MQKLIARCSANEANSTDFPEILATAVPDPATLLDARRTLSLSLTLVSRYLSKRHLSQSRPPYFKKAVALSNRQLPLRDASLRRMMDAMDWQPLIRGFRAPMTRFKSQMTPREFSRRELLERTAVGGLGITLPSLLRAESQRPADFKCSADHLVVVFLDGGPQPPRHVGHEARRRRRKFAANSSRSATSLPGVQVCEHAAESGAAHAPLRRWCGRCITAVNNAHAAAVYTVR